MTLMTYKDVAAYLGLEVTSLYALVKHKQIPHVRFNGRNVKFIKDDIDSWIQTKHVKAVPPSEQQ